MTAPPDATVPSDPGAPPRENWFDRPMRWAQLTLAENDPAQYDVRFWLDYFKEVRADAACLSAGGIVAYYPTDLPLHHRSAWLKDTDPFGDLVKGCRALGMHVIARTDPHAFRDDVERQNSGATRRKFLRSESCAEPQDRDHGCSGAMHVTST